MRDQQAALPAALVLLAPIHRAIVRPPLPQKQSGPA